MSVGTDTLTYIDPSLPLRRDLAWFREHVADLNVAHVWIHLPRPAATDPEVLRAVDRFQTAIASVRDVIEAVGPTTFLRLRRYFAGQGEELPRGPAQFARATADLEQLLLSEASLRGYVDVNGLQDINITVLFRQGDAQGYAALAAEIGRAWKTLGPAPLGGAQMRLVGESLLQVKVGASLVPTLAQSFAITAALIFVVFLFVFRSPTARLLAMIPSLFAILATFLGMRLFGASLNVATILIATTILGTTENDQIHFFHHLHERDGAPLGDALTHALRVSGRAIVFATLINAAGFLALSFSSFPPLRQFGLVTSAAFLLALVADFTALPAGLWMIDRRRRQPDLSK
jgi:predicted RND superfamily exporter protein